MDFNVESLKTLVGVQKEVQNQAEAANPFLRLYYLTKDRTHEMQGGQQIDADFSLAFTGLQFLEVNDRVCSLLQQKTGSPFGLTGSGIMCIRNVHVVDTSKDTPPSQSATELLTGLVNTAAMDHWGISGFKIVVFGMASKTIDIGPVMTSFPFAITVACEEKEWQSLFQLHTHELTAATEWYKQLQGKSEDVVTAADISPLRSLN